MIMEEGEATLRFGGMVSVTLSFTFVSVIWRGSSAVHFKADSATDVWAQGPTSR